VAPGAARTRRAGRRGRFRLFDIWKPFPARNAERLPGGLGVMADDLVAGAYANLGGQLVWRLLA